MLGLKIQKTNLSLKYREKRNNVGKKDFDHKLIKPLIWWE
jgi:hypothetical protein